MTHLRSFNFYKEYEYSGSYQVMQDNQNTQIIKANYTDDEIMISLLYKTENGNIKIINSQLLILEYVSLEIGIIIIALAILILIGLNFIWNFYKSERIKILENSEK